MLLTLWNDSKFTYRKHTSTHNYTNGYPELYMVIILFFMYFCICWVFSNKRLFRKTYLKLSEAKSFYSVIFEEEKVSWIKCAFIQTFQWAILLKGGILIGA